MSRVGAVIVFSAALLVLASCGAAAPPPTQVAIPAPTPSPTLVPATAPPADVLEETALVPATAAPRAPSPTVLARPAFPAAAATAAPSASPLPAPAAPAASPSPNKQNGRVVLGYYVPYDVTSWLTLEAQADQLDFVVAQWVSIDACGSIGSRDNRTLNAFARSRGFGVLPSLLTMEQALNHRLLTDEAVRARAIDQIVSYVVEEGYAGFDLDLENVPAGDRVAYTTFVARLSAALRERGKLLVAAIPAKRFDATTGWAGAYEYAALAPHLDYAMVMSYAYTVASSPPGSTAPFDWVDRVMSFVTSQISPSRVLLGLAFYGYDWNTTKGGSATALRYSQAAALAERYGASIAPDPATRSATFSYTARAGDAPPQGAQLPALRHEVAERKPPPCARPLPTAPPAPPRPTLVPKPTPTAAPLQQHVVWLEDAGSVAARLTLADRYGVAGVGAWRLGQEDPAVWPLLDDWRQGRR